MTATRDETARYADPQPVFVWFAEPDVGHPSLLMVILPADDGNGVVSRPLIALDAATAHRQEGLAQNAATELGVHAVLREYEYVSLLTRLEPQP